MDFTIQTSSPEPIYRQLVRQVKRAVAIGSLEPGDPLPSVRELAQRLVVNPNTVAQAYRELGRQGVVVTRRGVGTFVAERRDVLSEPEKRRILREGLERVITEAAHLGVSRRELRELLEECAEEYELPPDRKWEEQG
jgi:GntR family transcriptional regulator